MDLASLQDEHETLKLVSVLLCMSKTVRCRKPVPDPQLEMNQVGKHFGEFSFFSGTRSSLILIVSSFARLYLDMYVLPSLSPNPVLSC